jgi:hypothetical protein
MTIGRGQTVLANCVASNLFYVFRPLSNQVINNGGFESIRWRGKRMLDLHPLIVVCLFLTYHG